METPEVTPIVAGLNPQTLTLASFLVAILFVARSFSYAGRENVF